MISDQQDSSLNETVQKTGTALNPNANAFFCSKSVNLAINKDWESHEEPLTNGDLKQDDIGGGFSSGDSPVSDSPPVPFVESQLDMGAVAPDFDPGPVIGAQATRPAGTAAERPLSAHVEEVEVAPAEKDVSVSAAGLSTSSQSITSTPPVVNGYDNDPVYHESSEGNEQDTKTAGASSLPISDAELRSLLLRQLEYYFSRENLVQDHYLQSQMDKDQYVSITTIAKFNQVAKLTKDFNFIVEILRSSNLVQVDEAGTKVRPKHNRSVLMLREIPQDTPKAEVEALFSHENCPELVNCEFAHNGYWYITFKTDEDASKAFVFLREYEIKFKDKPVLARIKAKPLVRGGGGGAHYTPNKPPRNQQQQDAAVPFMQQQAQFPVMATPMSQFINQPQLTQAVPQFQLYNLQAAVVPQWGAANAAAHSIFDPGAILAMNGYQPANVKTATNHSRNIFHPMRSNASRGLGKPSHRPHSLNTEKIPDPRPVDRQHATSSHSNVRSNPRSSTHVSAESHSLLPHAGRNRSEGSSSNSHAGGSLFGSVNASPTPLVPEEGLALHGSPSLVPGNRQDANSVSVHQRRGGNVRRPRRTEEGPKNSRSQPSHGAKEEKPHEPHFELEATSFPPLPGSSNNSSTTDAPDGSKLSDVVKGTNTRPSHRSEEKVKSTSTANTVTPSAASVLTTAAAPFAMTRPTTVTTTVCASQTPSVSATAVVSAVTASVVKETDTSAVASFSYQSSTPANTRSSVVVDSAAHQTKTSKTSNQPSTTKPACEALTAQKQATVSSTGSAKQTQVPATSSVPTSNIETTPAKLSYAQMVSRRQQAENAAKQTVEDGSAAQATPAAARPAAQSASSEQTQTQTSASSSSSVPPKSASASARLPAREYPRNDSEPRQQRFQANRRTRDYRQQRFDRRRNDRDVKVPAK